MAGEIKTDGGASVGGDAQTGGGDFVGRDKKNENSADNNVTINIPMPTWANPLRISDPDDRTISVTVEESLRNEIRDLRGIIGSLSTNVYSLDKTLGGALQAVNFRLDLMEQLVNKLSEERKPAIDQSTLRLIAGGVIAIVVILAFIAWLLSRQGGFG